VVRGNKINTSKHKGILQSARKSLNLHKNICTFKEEKSQMLKTKDSNQLKFEAFKTPFEIAMDRNNRWINSRRSSRGKN